MRPTTLFTCIGLACLSTTACDPSPDLLDTLPPAEITAGEPHLIYSALLVYGAAVRPLMVDSSSTCPRVTVSGATTTIEGGCVDAAGVEWFGTVTMPSGFDPDAPTAGAIVIDAFGDDRVPSACPMTTERERRSGRVDLLRNADGSFDFEIDLTWEQAEVDESDCTVAATRGAIEYAGRVAFDGTQQTWSGSGLLGEETLGRLELQTEEEIYDPSVCEPEALSGTTTISAGEQEAVIAYDGASDCEDPATATWTLDGVDQGERVGVGCSVARGGRSGAPACLVALAALAVWRARRSGRARRGQLP